MNDVFDKMGEEQASRVAYLVAGYIRQTLTDKEHDELDEWITASDENQRLFEELTDPVQIQEGLRLMQQVNEGAAWERIKEKISVTGGRPSAGRKRWLVYSIAASLILLAGLVIFFMTTNKQRTRADKYTDTNIIKPGGNYATLTVAGGKKINLNEVRTGLIDSGNGNEVIKTGEAEISYEGNGPSRDEFHVLSTPAGGQYRVLLPDGTRVWLNSLSSLTYPVVFTGKERVVELSGEGYFEVRKEKAAEVSGIETGRRFIVKLRNNTKVEVLGTDFNISAYEDEKEIRTSLFTGVVNVYNGSAEKLLNPGYECLVRGEGSMITREIGDTATVMAWKDGFFKFKDADIETVMRQIARWYDAEIIYEGKADYHFNATIFRNEPVEKVLTILEETGRVHFRVEGRKIYVRP